MEDLTSVTGTNQPLPVLSKFLRRLAYRYNESGIGHWLPLIFATKVNIWGRFLTNIKQSIFPRFLPGNRRNMPVKYNRSHSQGATAARILVTTFVIAAIFTAAKKRKKTKAVSRR